MKSIKKADVNFRIGKIQQIKFLNSLEEPYSKIKMTEEIICGHENN